MLAKISKTFKGSLGNLMSDSCDSSNNLREYCGSVVSESTGYSMERRKEKRRSKRFRQMFSSDAEEDAKSALNMRSLSMVRLSLYSLQFDNLCDISIPWPWILAGEEQLMFLKRGLTAWRQRWLEFRKHLQEPPHVLK